MNSLKLTRRDSLKPDGLPPRWPYPTDADLEVRPQRIINVGAEQDYHYCDNFVKTSKYEYWNFLPKYLMEEFNPSTKFANVYFLIIACLQCVPAISNTFGYPTVLIPLVCVVFIDGVFQVMEDMARHKADKIANASPTVRYDHATHQFVPVQWFELQVGDFIKVETRNTVPADIVVLGCSEKIEPAQGVCYVETKSLDGETNLKLRNALPNTLGHVRGIDNLTSLKGRVEMEHPNNLIDSFSGIIELGSLGREAIQPSNVLLRGCVLRNTEFVIGMVLNTGHDCKIMMSSTTTKPKTSALETLASTQIKRIIIVLILVCVAGATGQAIWNSVNVVENIPYLSWSPNEGANWFIAFFYFFLLHATFIPVSLYVSMSIARFFQSLFMVWDLEMFYDKSDTPAIVRTMTLNEDLGQLSHIFSDKTGTLTCNVMDFRKMSVAGVSYGLGITEIGKASWVLQGKPIPQDVLDGERMAQEQSVPHVSFYDPKYERDMSMGNPRKSALQRFFHILALCHDVIPERVGNDIKLSASNPDDEALVCAAKYFGYEFLDRREKTAIVMNRETNQREEGLIIETIGFTSKRKRMSVFFRDAKGKIWLYCKGADTMMLPRLRSGQDDEIAKAENHLQEFGGEGLRCLVLGYAEISQDRFSKWHTAYRKAATNLSQIERMKKGEENEIENLQDEIESGMTLAGCSAIEDKLQAGVPECIADLVKAGLNIWLLTGDKETTAINIAVACNLVKPPKYMVQVIVNKKNAPGESDIINVLKEASDDFDRDSSLPRALIIDGPVLITALSSPEIRKLVLDFAMRCKAVVCCRVSPDQKREMVNLVKQNVPGVRTLAIGDGANDVAMIQAAHVGVGIKGEEGVQAVNSSDFAFAQFRFLGPLLLKHGRYNYIRMSNLVIYMFYKNILMSMAQWWFNFFCGFSGQKYYTEGGIQMFNLLFTSVPILLYAVYDMDLVMMRPEHPAIYQEGIKNVFFTSTVFWTWMVHALLESTLMALLPMGLLVHSDPENGMFNTFWEAGAMCLTAVVIVVNLKMFLFQNRWYPWSISWIILSIAFWFGIAFIATSFIGIDYDWYMIWTRLMVNGDFWLGLLLMVTVVMGKDIYLGAIWKNFYPTRLQLLQKRELEYYWNWPDFLNALCSRPMTDLANLTRKQDVIVGDETTSPAKSLLASRTSDPIDSMDRGGEHGVQLTTLTGITREERRAQEGVHGGAGSSERRTFV